MPRVLGIDPGTVSLDLFGLDDGRPVLDASLPTRESARAPERLVATIVEAGPWELIAGPSGYGLPLVPIERVGDREIFLAFLARPGESAGVGGFRTLVRRLREAGLPVLFTPGVIHLPSVPPHRKVNRIDMGTADKVCAAALAVSDQALRLEIGVDETSFVLLELGGAFTSALAVKGGRILDGLGGSSGPLGYLASGALDGEAAYLLGEVGKETVFSGGAAWVAGTPGEPPEALAERTDERSRMARDALVESAVKAAAALLAVVPSAREILLSGRLCRIPAFRVPLEEALARLAPVHRVRSIARTAKEAAQGAALIADGLAGGGHRVLVQALGLRDAAGTALDHLFLAGAERAWRWVREWERRSDTS